MKRKFFPAEWYPQSAVQLTWPHKDTDWATILDEVEHCFSTLVHHISKSQKVLIVCLDKSAVEPLLIDSNMDNVIFAEMTTNDTWARDHGGITVIEKGKAIIMDFCFNGWGLKFASNYDNQITSLLFKNKIVHAPSVYENHLGMVLEGGSIETDGIGTILTTAPCLLSANRNKHLSKQDIELYLYKAFNVHRILWLSNGYLAGDDTDSHIDTLARFCNVNTIAYVQCTDTEDEHYDSLLAMENEIKEFRTDHGELYNLVALPMADSVYEDGYRLPATYANFLITNELVLVPTYNSTKDEEAISILQKVFFDRKVIGVDCRCLIKQHGSLHCVTMQYPKEVVL